VDISFIMQQIIIRPIKYVVDGLIWVLVWVVPTVKAYHVDTVTLPDTKFAYALPLIGC